LLKERKQPSHPGRFRSCGPQAAQPTCSVLPLPIRNSLVKYAIKASCVASVLRMLPLEKLNVPYTAKAQKFVADYKPKRDIP
jgi:hypothetical protein